MAQFPRQSQCHLGCAVARDEKLRLMWVRSVLLFLSVLRPRPDRKDGYLRFHPACLSPSSSGSLPLFKALNQRGQHHRVSHSFPDSSQFFQRKKLGMVYFYIRTNRKSIAFVFIGFIDNVRPSLHHSRPLVQVSRSIIG